MLIRFYVENFLSFNEEVIFSMIPGKGRILSDHIIKGKRNNDVNILKTSVIYGANASGKSNLVRAMDFARTTIVKGHKKGTNIPIDCFRLEKGCSGKKSKFEFEFRIKNKIYAYGFTLNQSQIIEEWLYETGRTKELLIFERKTLDKNTIKLDLNLKNINNEGRKRLDYIAKDTPTNRLFLTECNSRSIENIPNIDDLVNVYYWFDRVLTIIFPESKYIELEHRIGKNINFSKEFTKYLIMFGTGISNIKIKEIDFEKEVIDIPDKIKKEILMDLEPETEAIISSNMNTRYTIKKDKDNNLQAFKIMTVHKLPSQKDSVLFEIFEESDGTQRLFDLIPALIELSNSDSVFVIDEVDRSLHPILTKSLIEYFLLQSKGLKNQLILTSHESSLLDLKLLRKDEIWFTEKRPSGSTSLYSLEEFKPRFDKEIRKGYLQGRFGAIPLISNLKDIGW